MRHLLDTRTLDRDLALRILDVAEDMSDTQSREVKKLPTLRGKYSGARFRYMSSAAGIAKPSCCNTTATPMRALKAVTCATGMSVRSASGCRVAAACPAGVLCST